MKYIEAEKDSVKPTESNDIRAQLRIIRQLIEGGGIEAIFPGGQEFLEVQNAARAAGLDFDSWFNSEGTWRVRIMNTPLGSKSRRPLCGARCRSGKPCQAHVCVRPDGRGLASKCRLHGGLTPRKPKSPAGRAAIAAANRTRAKR